MGRGGDVRRGGLPRLGLQPRPKTPSGFPTKTLQRTLLHGGFHGRGQDVIGAVSARV